MATLRNDGVRQRKRGGGGSGEEEEEDDEDSSPNLPISPLFNESETAHTQSERAVENLGEVLADFSLVTKGNTDHESTPNGQLAETPREAALEKFREQWRVELEGKQSGGKGSTKDESSVRSSRGQSPDTRLLPNIGDVRQEDFEKAKSQFLQGIEEEKLGQMREAVRCYNRAIHIVPDIESLLFNKGRTKLAKSTVTSACLSSETSSGHHTPHEIEQADKDLMNVFVDRLYSRELEQLTICETEVAQSGTHVSNLPIEVIFNILRWIIGPDMDMRSLEQISSVSAGFYILCRDPELWRLVCIRTWGLRSCTPSEVSIYPEWRNMFIERPHIWHNGVYISRVTYIRHGETSFQDQFYRPWHLVAYYRFLRFFSNGDVLMLTTPDEPSMVLPNIRTRNSRYPGLLHGQFTYSGPDLLSCSFTRRKLEPATAHSHFARKKKSALSGHEPVEHTFNIEMRIANLRKKRHCRLQWVTYDLKTKKRDGSESQTDFDLNETSFPPFSFSRVRSYGASCERPLL